MSRSSCGNAASSLVARAVRKARRNHGGVAPSGFDMRSGLRR